MMVTKRLLLDLVLNFEREEVKLLLKSLDAENLNAELDKLQVKIRAIEIWLDQNRKQKDIEKDADIISLR